MSLESFLAAEVAKAVKSLFNADIEAASVAFSATNPSFEGDITLVVFPYVKLAGKGPEQTGQLIGDYLKQNVKEIASYNVVKGFLNLVISDEFWKARFKAISTDKDFGKKELTPDAPFVMVEYSSPNTNKPLHLGHIRNNLLGYSVSEILKADGNKVMKVNLVNDRGIHICKSMVAWELCGGGETPEESGMKGDHLVGKYYVLFDKLYKEANINFVKGIYSILSPLEGRTEPNGLTYALEFPFITQFIKGEDISGLINKEEELKQNHRQWFNNNIRLKILNMQKSLQSDFAIAIFNDALNFYDNNFQNHPMTLAINMLQDWERGDVKVKSLWKKMNDWVYDGFSKTYKKLGVDFDKIYYESNTYILGKEIIEEGLKKNVFVKRDDGAVIIDLTADGLDQKVLLRSDGTSVYMTQDLGTAVERHKEFPFDKHIYVVGNEQDYHFKVLKLTLEKLGYKWAKGLYHLSYGMVELPDGKMKSREGTVVDADDLISDMENNARLLSEEKGLVEGMAEEEKQELYHRVGMAALKYFMLKVDPKKKMLFNPQESIDLHGNTGPFIQYTYARCRSILRKAGITETSAGEINFALQPKEKELVKILNGFPAAISNAAKEYSPAVIANYTYELAKVFNQFYDVCPVIKEENAEVKNFRLALTDVVSRTIETAFSLLGIGVPERM